MKKHFFQAAIGLIAGLLAVGIVFSQSTDEPDFTLIQEIGQISPRGVQYDPNFDRFVMVDARGQLVLADAQTREVQHVLYTTGTYYGYTFSHNGLWLAVAQGNTIHIWNTQTGERDLDLQPTVALSFSQLLQFSDDDELLLFKAIVPAPDDIRISEDDTTLTPWLWDLEAERGTRQSILPEFRRAQPFFDLRTELLLTPNNKLIAALPRSISVTDFSGGGYNVVTNLQTNRFEFDPIDIWYSLRGEQAYLRTLNQPEYYQINTETGQAHFLPIGRELSPREINAQSQLEFARVTQFIGDGSTRTSNSLSRLLLSGDYHPNSAPVTVMLLDVLDPITIGEDQAAFLVYIFNEETGRGVIDLVRPTTVTDFALNPAQTQIAVRLTAGDVEIYDIHTGALMTNFVPRYPDVPQNDIFTFDQSGDALLVGWNRYAVHNGEPLIEAARFHPGFGEFNFANNDSSIVTINRDDLWVWDIVSGLPVRQQTIRVNGELIERSLDAGRYLSRIPFPGEATFADVPTPTPQQPAPTEAPLFDEESTDPEALLQRAEIPAIRVPVGEGIEIYDVFTDDRERLFYELLPNRNVREIIASPDWQHLLVIYDAYQYSQHFPGNEIAIYSVTDGLLWFYAGDDLPAPGSRRYGWRDNNTVFVVNAGGDPSAQPERIYGLDYHPSGLPACIVDAFPEDWTQWRDLWERLNARLRGDELGRLTQRLCAADLTSQDAVDDVFFPSPTPRRPPSRPTSSRIAGLPTCLSSFYGRRAADFAPQWRALTEGLDDTQIAEVEEILCMGLSDGVDVPVPNVGSSGASRSLQAVSIDIRTGERTLSAFAPIPVAEPRPLEPIINAFRDQFGFVPRDARLSDNAEYLAVRTANNHVQVYRLNRPYNTYIDALQATANAAEAGLPVSVQLQATPTAPGIPLGGPRPTLTPTITPTPPPLPEATVTFDEQDVIIEVCDHDRRYDMVQPPADFVPTGRLLAIDEMDINVNTITTYLPATGRTRLEEDVIDPALGELSPGQNWLLLSTGEIVVARADGTEPIVLFERYERPEFPINITWIDENTLQIVTDGYLPEFDTSTHTFVQDYDVQDNTYTAPVTPTPLARVNSLSTSLVSVQPQVQKVVVLGVPYNAGTAPGTRYFLMDTETGELDYFARVDDGSSLTILWQPAGDAMYYRFASAATWYLFDPATEQHWVLGDLPGDQWSRDGRYRWTWLILPRSEIEERVEAGEQVPKLAIWDSVTGLTRHYCIPGTEFESFGPPVFWAPDGRYLAFNIGISADVVDDIQRQRTFILDTQTGSVTELARTINRIILWTE